MKPQNGAGRPDHGTPHIGASGQLLALARSQAQAGKLTEAVLTFRRLLTQEPRQIEAWLELGQALVKAGKWHDAAAAFSSAVSLQPRNADALYQMADALFGAQRAAEAELALSEVLRLHPRFAKAWVLLGRVQERLGKPEAAIASHQQAVECAPRFAEAHFQLARMLRLMRRPDEAIAAYENAIRCAPDYADAHNNLGMIFKAQGRFDHAIAAFQRAVTAAPKHYVALCNLGNTLWAAEKFDEAVAAYRACIAAAPAYVYAYTNIANVRREQRNLGEALEFARRAIEIDSRNAEAHAALASTLYAQGNYEKALTVLAQARSLVPRDARSLYEVANACRDCGQLHDAIAIYRSVGELDPDFAAAYYSLGLLLQDVGDLAGAESAYRAAIRSEPKFGAAHHSLAQLVKYRERDDHVRAMESLLEEKSLPPLQRVAVMFALAKAFDDIRDFDRSFEFLHAANREKRNQLLSVHRQFVFDLNDKLVELMNASFFDRIDGAGDPSAVPIVIVGMPRSGTSLVEQIIASHSQVHGAGELLDLTRITDDWVEQVRAGSFPKRASELAAEDLSQRGSRYVAALRRHSSTATYVTDKEPFNYRLLGFLRLILPNAKIIHCMRDPVDTCMSSYKRLFGAGMFFSYDLQDLGNYYNSYRKLMDHWRAVLPRQSMFEVQYEDLVADQEGKTRELLSFCGLPWEEQCMNFHENERAVRTPSFAQVRQPIYKTAVASSRKYYPYIQPLLETLGVNDESAAR